MKTPKPETVNTAVVAEVVVATNVTIYDANGKPTTATEEDAAAMVEHCGYSTQWPPKKAEAPAPSEKPAAGAEDQAADAATAEAAGSSKRK